MHFNTYPEQSVTRPACSKLSKIFQRQHSAVEYPRSEMSLKSEHLLTETLKVNEPLTVLRAMVFLQVPKYRQKNLMSWIITETDPSPGCQQHVEKKFGYQLHSCTSKTPLDVNLCKNQESYVRKRLGTHPEYYGNVTIFGKLLDQRVAQAYTRIKAHISKLAYLEIFLKTQNKVPHFMKRDFFHFMFQISYYVSLYAKFLSLGVFLVIRQSRYPNWFQIFSFYK